MAYSKIQAMAEPQSQNWMEWFKSIQFFGVALIIPLWRAIDKYFEYQSKKDREFIKSVVQEAITSTMQEIRSDIKDVKDDIKEVKVTIDQDRKDINKEILALTKEIKRG